MIVSSVVLSKMWILLVSMARRILSPTAIFWEVPREATQPV